VQAPIYRGPLLILARDIRASDSTPPTSSEQRMSPKGRFLPLGVIGWH
jgi:hypothetical protein